MNDNVFYVFNIDFPFFLSSSSSFIHLLFIYFSIRFFDINRLLIIFMCAYVKKQYLNRILFIIVHERKKKKEISELLLALFTSADAILSLSLFFFSSFLRLLACFFLLLLLSFVLFIVFFSHLLYIYNDREMKMDTNIIKNLEVELIPSNII